MSSGRWRCRSGEDNKQTGGSITSARRFAIMAALGIASVGEDSGDENGARRASSGNHATAKQLAKIAAEVDRGGVTDGGARQVLHALRPRGVHDDRGRQGAGVRPHRPPGRRDRSARTRRDRRRGSADRGGGVVTARELVVAYILMGDIVAVVAFVLCAAAWVAA